ncbi:MAG: hypothetical protein AAFZ80_01995 [Cyanobacteria bacterium P01_A01_bin.105]
MTFSNGAPQPNGAPPNGRPIDLAPDLADRIVPAALRAWLIFLLLFTLLGYPVGFSILFGAAGGFAWGTISAWWSIPGGAPMSQAAEEQLGISRLGFKLPNWQIRRAKRRRIYRRSRQ